MTILLTADILEKTSWFLNRSYIILNGVSRLRTAWKTDKKYFIEYTIINVLINTQTMDFYFRLYYFSEEKSRRIIAARTNLMNSPRWHNVRINLAKLGNRGRLKLCECIQCKIEKFLGNWKSWLSKIGDSSPILITFKYVDISSIILKNFSSYTLLPDIYKNTVKSITESITIIFTV